MARAAQVKLKVNPPLGNLPALQWALVSQLQVDDTYQRSAQSDGSMTLIRKIAVHWNWDLCQPLVVSRRVSPASSTGGVGQTEYFVIDGQHRLLAAKARGDINQLPCVVVDYASAAAEAASFVQLNQLRRPLTRLEVFKASLAGGDADAEAIAAAITGAGLTLAAHENYLSWRPGMVANIDGIERAWRQHGAQLRQLLAGGQQAEARSLVGGLLQRFPGSIDLLTLAGDMELLGGNGAAALPHYRQAARVRSNWPLVQRMVSALVASGAEPQARALLADHLRHNPREQRAAALLGRMQRDAGNPARATVLLRHAASLGAGPDDPLLLADLAQLEASLGHAEAALERASAAHRLQRGNRRVAQVFGRIAALQGGNRASSRALLAKAAGRGI